VAFAALVIVAGGLLFCSNRGGMCVGESVKAAVGRDDNSRNGEELDGRAAGK